MKLDDLKSVINKESKIISKSEQVSLDGVTNELANFNNEVRRNTMIETAVALIALLAVLLALGFGNSLYQLVITQLFPEIAADRNPSMNITMYLSMILMGIYCLFVPVKLSLAQRGDDSLSWTLTSRVSAEISKLEKQNKHWSSAHIWSFTPAIIIGLLFFWGLQFSLTGEWFPSIYLTMYFAFIFLSTLGGFRMKKNMTKKRITPMIDKLYGIRKQLLDEM
jgi:hypothetical protein